jgi:hypothetical protein
MARPKFGEVYQAARDIKVVVGVFYKAPASDALDGEIPQGTNVVLLNNPPSTATAILAAPLNYRQLEEKLVPECERQDPFYNGYGLTIKLADLETYFSKDDKAAVRFDDKRMQVKWEKMLQLQKDPIVKKWLKKFQ